VKKTILLMTALVLLLVLSPSLRLIAGQALPVHVRSGGDVDYEVVIAIGCRIGPDWPRADATPLRRDENWPPRRGPSGN